MIDSLPTVWPAEAHTLVKHKILRRYLQAWFPILTQQRQILRQQSGLSDSREILFIDGFAGPGEYEGGELGSPLIALDEVLKPTVRFPVPVQMLFIEHRPDRYAHLEQLLDRKAEQIAASPNLRGVLRECGDCDSKLNQMLDDCERRRVKFGPALAFLDQFGYGAVSMELITRILSYPQCEVFTYLSYKEMNRWITDDHKADAFTRAFGGEEWKECINLPERQRRENLLSSYKTALQSRARAKYVVSFLMFDTKNQPLYWLLFCTNNIRGLEEMKRAMWNVDKTGEFRFSDRDNPAQLQLLEEVFDQKWLAAELRTLAGRTMSVAEIKEHVLAHTPCYLFKTALKSLEASGAVVVAKAPPDRKPKTYPDEQLSSIFLSLVDSPS
jgi:three-Cys-motif partner protein